MNRFFNPFLALAAIVLMALLSCRKEGPETIGPPEVPSKEITFNIDVSHPGGADTKAVKTVWENGAVIFLHTAYSLQGTLELGQGHSVVCDGHSGKECLSDS